MGKLVFSWGKQPYYTSVVVFCALAALISSHHNDTATGIESDIHLALMIAFAALAAWAGYYFFSSFQGADLDADADVAGVHVSKYWFYVGVLAACAYRGFIGYGMNHNLTGVGSFYGKLWLAASVVLAIYTWGNWKSYQTRHPEAQPDIVKNARL